MTPNRIGSQSPQAACKPARQRYALEIEHCGDDATMALRSALKVLWRRFDFRCVSVKESPGVATARPGSSADSGVADG